MRNGVENATVQWDSGRTYPGCQFVEQRHIFFHLIGIAIEELPLVDGSRKTSLNWQGTELLLPLGEAG
jgi:hypothetical protein